MAELKKLVFLTQLTTVANGVWAKVKNLFGSIADTAEGGAVTIKPGVLPKATSQEYGAVKIGSGLQNNNGEISVDAGNIEVNPANIAKATKEKTGVVQVGSGIDVAEGVISVTMPTAKAELPAGDASYAAGDFAGVGYVDAKIDALVDGAPGTLDTLKEIAEYLDKPESEGVAGGLTQQIAKKADKATTLAGYGIADAKIADGVITLGSESITPLTKHQTLADLGFAEATDEDIAAVLAALV